MPITHHIQGLKLSSYKAPSFQDRLAAAGSAKQKVLDALKAKPPVDEALMEEKRLAREAKEKALAEARAAKAEALAKAKAEKEERRAAQAAADAEKKAEADAAAALKAVRLTPPSAAEMKAARDARYAARKARK